MIISDDIPRFVILDDDHSMLRLIEVLLLNAFEDGLHLITTTNPESVLAMARAGDIDVCLTDLDMPNTNGFEIIESLKQIDSMIQVVLLTAVADWNALESATALGVCDYLLKPIVANELIDVSKSAVSRHKRRKRDFRILS